MARTLRGFLCLALFWTAQTAPAAPDMSSDSCKDYGLSVAGSRVDCSVLLTPNSPGDNILGVYDNRAWWCGDDRQASCCQTCKKVREEIEAASNNNNQTDSSNTSSDAGNSQQTTTGPSYDNSNRNKGNSETGNDQSNVEDQSEVVNTKGTSKVQPKTESGENHNHQMQHFVDKTSQDGPGFEIFVDMQRHMERDKQAIESIDIKIFPGRR